MEHRAVCRFHEQYLPTKLCVAGQTFVRQCKDCGRWSVLLPLAGEHTHYEEGVS